jgi:Domain of unknown function (DUF4304)
MIFEALKSALDDELRHQGFVRKNNTWYLRSGALVLVINLQLSNSRESYTVNLGVLDHGVYFACWGKMPKTFFDEVDCTVRSRIGDLQDGRDIWWDINDPDAPNEVLKLVQQLALPFLERMSSQLSMRDWLLVNGGLDFRPPLVSINYAILLKLCGDSVAACNLLKRLQVEVRGAWKINAAKVADRLSCKNLGIK